VNGVVSFAMPKTMTEVLKRAILRCKMSAGELSRAAGVPQQTISEFLRGRDMRMSRAEKIAAYLGLELAKKPKRKH
jgi:predicted transcriptional regulator